MKDKARNKSAVLCFILNDHSGFYFVCYRLCDCCRVFVAPAAKILSCSFRRRPNFVAFCLHKHTQQQQRHRPFCFFLCLFLLLINPNLRISSHHHHHHSWGKLQGLMFCTPPTLTLKVWWRHSPLDNGDVTRDVIRYFSPSFPPALPKSSFLLVKHFSAEKSIAACVTSLVTSRFVGSPQSIPTLDRLTSYRCYLLYDVGLSWL